MKKKLRLTVSLVAFFASASFAFANLTQVDLQPQSSFTCNATGTIYYSLSNNQLMLCTSGSNASPVLTSSGSSGTGASFSTLTVSGTTTLATASGNVGIGTTLPNYGLDINVSSGARVSQPTSGLYGNLTLQGGDTFRAGHLLMQTSNGTNAFEVYSNTTQTTLNATGTLSLNGSSSGYVGINTTSPGTNLDVNGNIDVGSVLYDRANTNYYVNPSGNIMPYSANLGGSVSVAGSVTAGNQLVNLLNNTTGSYGTNPTLLVGATRGSQNWGDLMEIRDSIGATGGDRPAILFSSGMSSSSWSVGMGVYGQNDNFNIGYRNVYPINNWATSYFTVTTGGSVGIGTSAPAAELEVTGPMLDSNGGNILHYRNVLHYYVGGGTHTGTLEIIMPNSWNNTMMQMTIRGYDYANNNGAWEARVGGYNYQPNSAWYNYSAQISGRAPFSSVRLAYDSSLSKNVILLGTTGTSWNYEAVDVSDFIASYGSQSSWGSGWSAALLTSETNIADVATPAIDIYDSTGNIGIGTVNPQQSLEISNLNSYQLRLGNGNGSSAYTYDIGRNGSDGLLYFYGNQSGYEGYVFTGVNGEYMRVANGGTVGIGTASPMTAGLVVSKNVSGAGIDVNNNRIINVGTPVNAADAATKSYVDSAVTGGSSSGNLSTLTVSGTTTLATNGTSFVGIGTTAPSQSLTVNGNILLTGGHGIYSGYNNNYILNDHNNGNVTLSAAGGDLYLGYQNTSHVRLYQSLFDSNGTNQIINANGFIYQQNSSVNNYFAGNVGIGTTPPSTNLDVNGNINVGSVLYDRANTNYYLNPSGNIMAYAANLGGGVNIANGNLSVEGMQENVIQSSVSSGDMTILLGNLSIGGAQVFVSYNGGWANDVGYFVLNVPYWGTALDVQQGIQSSSNNRIQFYYKYLNDGAVYVAMTITNDSPSKSYGMSARIEIVSDVYNSATTPFSGYSPATVRSSVSEGNATFAGGIAANGSMYSVEADNGTATGATTIDWSKSNTQTLVLGASPIALTFNNGQPGGHYTLALKQDATGSRLVTWPGNVRWSSGVAPTLTTTANKTDYVEFVYDGLSSTFDGVGFNANF